MWVCEDAHAMSACLSHLRAATLHPEPGPHAEWGGGEEWRGAALEAALLARWHSALHTMSPPPPPAVAAPTSRLQARLRGQRKTEAPKPENFSPRQLDYIAQVSNNKK